MDKSVSPSREYVAVCCKLGGKGHYFVKFHLPDNIAENNSKTAAWYYLNSVDYTSMIEGCFSLEDFEDVRKAEEYS